MNLQMHTDRDFDARLDELEREMEPVLTKIWRAPEPRPQLAARLRENAATETPPTTPSSRPPLSLPLVRLSRQRAWGALAAVLAGSVIVGSAALLYRPQQADAQAVIDQLQTEATNGLAISGPAGCAPPAGAADPAAGRTMVYATGGAVPAPGQSGPVSASNASQLSDKLAAALGVSGDQVRQAMLETMQSLTPATAPPDPMAGIAQQLGMPEDQVCQAFFSTGAPVGIMIGKAGGADVGVTRQTGGAPGAPQPLNLTTASTDQLAPYAAKLGVSPEKLQSAIKAFVASVTPAQMPTPPSQQQIVSTFAHNLGIDEARVSSAMSQVEGNGGFYFAVPLPGSGH